MSDEHCNSPVHTIVAGYGLPGRIVVDWLASHHIAHCIIELNPATVHRCEKSGTSIIEGSCTDPQVLKHAGIDTAQLLVLAIPDQKAALEATSIARQLNPRIRIITRCHYTSAGIEAKARGADEVIVAEQIVAEELLRRLDHRFQLPK
ncbi:MAG TPA: NAD(P)-binding protein [Tepidisphaeraceae bacterium]|nr:NAD(P)-binding protein [Tepidisphaeraceae bacterium]